jgi:hypothetical protein
MENQIMAHFSDTELHSKNLQWLHVVTVTGAGLPGRVVTVCCYSAVCIPNNACQIIVIKFSKIAQNSPLTKGDSEAF